MARFSFYLPRDRKIGIAGFGLLIFVIIFRTVIFPSFLKSHIQKTIALKKGSPMRETWSESRNPYEVRVYLFNVTNPYEIAKGEKPVVKEVGPFVYDTWHEKINQTDHEEDDTLSYSFKDTYFFNAWKSNGLSDDTELTLIHLVCIAIPNKILKSNPSVLGYAVKGIDNIVNNPDSIFIKVKVKTFLFDGIYIECKGKDDFFSKAVCNDMEEFWFKYRMKKGDGTFASSIYGNLNGTDYYTGTMRVRRGTKNIMEVGDIIEYNGMKNMSVWKNDICDELIGTDGTMFHPFLDAYKKKMLYVTQPYYCRHFPYQYESDVKFAGLKLVRYTTSIGTDMQSNPNDKCFCIAPDKCLKDGVYEQFKCSNLASISSNPHFYLADPYYGSAVDGLNPEEEKHISSIDIDPLTGLAIRTHFRIQYCMELRSIKKYRLMQNFPEALLPMLWIEKVTIMPNFLLKKIKNNYRIITFAKIFSYLMMFSGFVMLGYASFKEYKRRKRIRITITTVESETKEIQLSAS